MSDFRAKIVADLDISKIPGQLAKIGKQKIILSNFDLNAKDLVSKIQQAINNQKFTLNLTDIKTDNLSKAASQQMHNAGQEAGQEFSKSFLNHVKSIINTGGIDAYVAKVTQQFDKLNTVVNGMGSGAKSTELQGQLRSLEHEFAILNQLQDELTSGGLNDKQLLATYNKFDKALWTVKNSLTVATSETKKFASEVQVATLQSKMEDWLVKNSKASKEYGQSVRQYADELKRLSSQGNVTTADLQRIADGFKKIDSAASIAGVKGKTFFDKLKGALSSITRYVNASTLIYSSFAALKQGVTDVIELDSALIDLKKTTTATATELESFYYSSNDTAKSLGATTKEVIQAAADWSRLGLT